MEKGVFKVVHRSEVPDHARIFGLGFVDEVKHAGTEQAIVSDDEEVKPNNEEVDLMIHGKTKPNTL